MSVCKACKVNGLAFDLSDKFNKIDRKFCQDELSSEKTDSLKWEIVDQTLNFCNQHRLEFLENE